MRNLVTLRKVRKLEPIEGADNILLAHIDGWQCVVKKDEFKENDWGVYFEIDSIIPHESWNDHLFKSESDRNKGKLRIKTIRLRGQLSQGLLLPVSLLEGKNLTEVVSVEKYEPPIPSDLNAKSHFPSFIQKTDEERIQNLVDKLTLWATKKVYVTEKLDGTSITCYVTRNTLTNEVSFGICSRNLELDLEATNKYTETVKKLGIEEKMREWSEKNNADLVIQGELIGEGIQGNKYNLTGTDIYFFTVQDGKHKRLPLSIINELGLKTVPFLESGVTIIPDHNVILQYAEGKSVLNGNTEREGVVIRAMDESFSFKAISNKFLLKNNE